MHLLPQVCARPDDGVYIVKTARNVSRAHRTQACIAVVVDGETPAS
jgi:hypothetical protein